MGKKLGIITYHRADNLGAVLQAYALQRVLTEGFSCHAEIVDYRCEKIENARKHAFGIKALLLQAYYTIKHSAFEAFRKRYLTLSPSVTKQTISQCAERYDAFITGSDQVWNYECSEWDDAYFLSFAAPGKKKYAYAASLGRYRFADEEQAHVTALLQDFSRISVREVSAVQELQKLGIDSVVCTDPVILLKKEQWMQIMPGRRYKGKYLFVYLIMEADDILNRAKAYAKEHGFKVIYNKASPEFILHGSPVDFLSWIYHSECVFTNSFHGTAFSLIFGKPLAADTQYADGRVNERVFEMLKGSNALECALKKSENDVVQPDAEPCLCKMREASYEYLEAIYKDI